MLLPTPSRWGILTAAVMTMLPGDASASALALQKAVPQILRGLTRNRSWKKMAKANAKAKRDIAAAKAAARKDRLKKEKKKKKADAKTKKKDQDEQRAAEQARKDAEKAQRQEVQAAEAQQRKAEQQDKQARDAKVKLASAIHSKLLAGLNAGREIADHTLHHQIAVGLKTKLNELLDKANSAKGLVGNVINNPDSNELPDMCRDVKETTKFVTQLKSTANICKSMITTLQRLE